MVCVLFIIIEFQLLLGTWLIIYELVRSKPNELEDLANFKHLYDQRTENYGNIELLNEANLF